MGFSHPVGVDGPEIPQRRRGRSLALGGMQSNSIGLLCMSAVIILADYAGMISPVSASSALALAWFCSALKSDHRRFFDWAVVVQTVEIEPIRGLEVAAGRAASTAFPNLRCGLVFDTRPSKSSSMLNMQASFIERLRGHAPELSSAPQAWPDIATIIEAARQLWMLTRFKRGA